LVACTSSGTVTYSHFVIALTVEAVTPARLS
jgi:hypothetical protein